MKIKRITHNLVFFLLFHIIIFPILNAQLAIDLIDDVLKNGGSDPYNGVSGSSYDFTGGDPFNGYTGIADGTDDITIIVSTTGTGTNVNPNSDEVGNSTTYTSNDSINGTGLVSTISSSGTGVETNNSGISTATNGQTPYRITQTIDILLAPHIFLDSVDDFSVSSANTGVASSIVWEFSYIQFLDRNGDPFDMFTFDDIEHYLAHQGNQINGNPAGNPNTLIGDDTDTITGVGTDDVTGGPGGNGPLNSLNNLNSAFAQNIGGFRFVHVIEDTRGITDSNFGYTATINDLDINLLPEPNSLIFLLISCILFTNRKR